MNLQRLCGGVLGVVSQPNNSISLVQDALKTPSRIDTISYTIGQALKTPSRQTKTPSSGSSILPFCIGAVRLENYGTNPYHARNKSNPPFGGVKTPFCIDT